MKKHSSIVLLLLMYVTSSAQNTDTASVGKYLVKKTPTYTSAVELTKMNVLYVGVDNPIVIKVPGHQNFSVKLSEGIITKNGDLYTINVSRTGKTTLYINDENGKGIDFRDYRVKRTPDPVASIGGMYFGGLVGKNELLAAKSLIPILTNFDLEMFFKITGYKMTIVSKGKDLIEFESTGSPWTQQMIDAVQRTQPGDRIFFEYIKCKMERGADQSTRSLSALGFTIQ